jgi:tetratricopeptide (TPR) repeat protein
MPRPETFTKSKPGEPANRREWLRNGLIAAALFAITFLAFAPALRLGLTNIDDRQYVTLNPDVHAGLTPGGWTWAWTTFREGNWHPLTWLSLQADVSLFGDRPAVFHATNVVLHAANAVLLFLALTVITGAPWRVAPAVALWAVHPLRVESVAWVSERKDVLSIFFGLLALLAYGYYVRRPGVYRYLAVLIALALSLLAKPMLITLPFLLLVLDWWPLGRFPGGPAPATAGPKQAVSFERLLAEKAPLLALTVVSSVVTVFAQKAGGAVQTLETVPLATRFATVPIAYAVYLLKTVWPFDLAVLYAVPEGGWPAGAVVIACLALLLLTGLVVALRRREPNLLAGWLWYAGTLVPVIGLVQVGIQAYADRYTYFPLIGIFVALAWWLTEPAFRGYLGIIGSVAGAVLVGLVALTWRQIGYWQDDVVLWNHTIEVTGDNNYAYHDLLFTLNEQGKWPECLKISEQALRRWPQDANVLGVKAACLTNLGRTEEALALLNRLQKLTPDDPKVDLKIGHILGNQGRYKEALPYFRAAVAKGTDVPEVYFYLGRILRLTGQLPEALTSLRKGFRLAPDNAEICCELALILGEQGEPKEALVVARRAVDLKPENALYKVYLAAALARTGQDGEVQELLREAFRLDPHWPAGVDELAWSLATGGNGRLAVELAQLVCRATGDQQARFEDTLAAAYAGAGRFDEARDAALKAIALATAAGQTELARDAEARLQLYKQDKVFRGNRPPGR